MNISNRNLLNTILILTMLSFTISVNAASTGSSSVARKKCSSVEQEVVDFETLEKRIRKTSAIGGLTKLKLSGDINKMVADLKTYHAGDSPHTLEQHREQYDLLYMKVVSKVQDKDPELFNQLCNAWDPLWAELQDENNLKKVSQTSPMENETIAGIIDVFTSVMNAVISSAYADEILSHDEIVKRDLLVVVAAHGVVCTAVTLYQKITNHDYVATCEGGDKYRVNVSDEGRVNVAPHKQ
ncbi:MAG: hypothetical protein KAI77_05785 [Gammaproteobacteria bacterium]|nr:hypothetical protein [Gammaproteobacteria bacterium]